MGHRSQRLKLSGSEAGILVHKWRSENDAILIGKKTAIADNPSLTTRHYPGDSSIRVVLDAHLEVPPHSILLNDGLPSMLVNEMKESQDGPVKYLMVNDVRNLEAVLSSLFEAGIFSVLVEGGASVLQAFVKSGLWDEARVIRTPELLGNKFDVKDLVKAPDIHGKLVNEIEVGNGERVMFLDRGEGLGARG
ncbi:MAG: RibD family protein [Saprospiraceae bacterium]|nr:RibD family protein [Saprospiraceae bacterium]